MAIYIYLFKKCLENCEDPRVVEILSNLKCGKDYYEFTKENSWDIWVSVLVPQINEDHGLLDWCVGQFVRGDKPKHFKALLQTLKPEASEGSWVSDYYSILLTECFIYDRPSFLKLFFPGEQQIVEMKSPLTRDIVWKKITEAKECGAIECDAFLQTIDMGKLS
jgi:hypothetical protein